MIKTILTLIRNHKQAQTGKEINLSHIQQNIKIQKNILTQRK